MVNNYILYPKAKEDLEYIFKYISKELINRDGALKLINRFEDKFLSLISFPLAYPIIDDIRLDLDNLRKCYIDNFVIIYLVNKSKKQIEIVRVVYQRKDYFKDL